MKDQFEIKIEIQPLLDVLRAQIYSDIEDSDQMMYLKTRIIEEGLHDEWNQIKGQYVQYRMGRQIQEDPTLIREYLLSQYPSLLYEPILQPITQNTSRAISDNLIQPIDKNYLPFYEQTVQAILEHHFQA